MNGGETQSNGSRGIGFIGLLQLLFIGLKLGGVIDWSWWWVMSPFIGSLCFAVLLLAFAGVLLLIIARRK